MDLLFWKYNRRWYLVGLFKSVQNSGDLQIPFESIGNYALDRITGIENAIGYKYIEQKNDEYKQQQDQIIGTSFNNDLPIEEIEFRLKENRAKMVKTKFLHNSQKILRELKNGDIIFSIKVQQNNELVALLLQFGSDIEIVKPITLRNKIMEILTAALGYY